MGLLLSRSVEIQVHNKTRSITLRNPRTYLECGSCSERLHDVAPGSTVSFTFPGSFPFWGVAGILAFEADSFTLALYFSNPIDYNKFHTELGLELSRGQAHDDLESTCSRMAKGNYSSSCPDLEFHRVALSRGDGSARLSHGPLRVVAAMSSKTRSVLKVELEEEEGSPEEGEPRPREARTRGNPGQTLREAPGRCEKPPDTPKPGRLVQDAIDTPRTP